MTKIDIITGFLGAGKTTFIKSLISERFLEKENVVILENEFGDVNIDANLLSGHDIPIFEITKGCICCSLKGDFISTLIEISEKHKPDRLIIEPSGIFILETLYDLLAHDQIKELYRLNSVTSLVDVTLFDGRFIPMEGFIRQQIRQSNYVVFSKISDKITLSHAKDFVQTTNVLISTHEWYETEGVSTIATSILKLSRIPLIENFFDKEQTTHSQLSSITIRQANSPNFQCFNNFIKDMKAGYFGDIIRMKGTIKIEGDIYECHLSSGTFNYQKVTYTSDHSFVVIGTNLNQQKINQVFVDRRELFMEPKKSHG